MPYVQSKSKQLYKVADLMQKTAIARLRSYVPPPTCYYSLPLSRRAAVLILLYGDQQGELRVILTMRARELNSYGGHSSFPGVSMFHALLFRHSDLSCSSFLNRAAFESLLLLLILIIIVRVEPMTYARQLFKPRAAKLTKKSGSPETILKFHTRSG